ncbi:MAG TPA: AAA family ATPase [Patescibacteria group bacterium]|nr:AAA family ATPase [Patescibacteria group bacterium]
MAHDRVIAVPSPGLVVLVGPAASGKSTLCERSFKPTQIVSSEACRALVADDPAAERSRHAAFELAQSFVEERLRRRRLAVLDATSLEETARGVLLTLAARHHLPAVAIALDLPLDECRRLDERRGGTRAGTSVIARHAAAMRRAVTSLPREGFRSVHRVQSARDAAALRIDVVPLSCDRTGESGPFDVIGDLHGCDRELVELLGRLGYRRASGRKPFRHPGGRRAVFVGDLVDRGPDVIGTATLAMDMIESGSAFAVPGNHDDDLAARLETGADAAPADVSPGTAVSLRQIEAAPAAVRREFTRRFPACIGTLPSHVLLDGERLVVAHAGLREEFHGRESRHVHRLAVHGETTGRLDRYGLPTRINWAARYEGRPFVVYGHTPVPKPEAIRNTLNIDTGCVYGGALTSLRWPEKETVSVRAARIYYQSPRRLPARVGLRASTRDLPSV